MSYYITVQSFQLDPCYISGAPEIDLGDGVNMNDPRCPTKSELSVFNPESKEKEGTKKLKLGAPISNFDITDTFHVEEYSSSEEESNTLSQYFKASYGLASVSQSLKIANKERDENQTIYALLEHSGESIELKEPNWRESPESYMTGDPEECLELFLARYGSHYVSAIKYGLRMGVQAKLKKSEKTKSTNISVDFNAAFDGASVGGGVSNEHSQKLEKKGVEILFEATSGGRVDGGLVTVRGIDQINRLLDDIGTGKTQFKVAPIQVYLSPYWPLLDPEWKNTRRVLKPHDQELPLANYGVPKGTIIPWYPPPEYVQGLEDKSKEVKITPPDGWAICDGIGGTPNLKGKFIRSIDKFSNIGQSGGAENHSHGGKTKGPEPLAKCGGGTFHNLPYENHTHIINEDNHLPPYIWLVYIMKM
ncbi:MAG: hypothetical protein ACYTE8_07870 [Planctomycetota bacterium]|jgi:hypothetical protein